MKRLHVVIPDDYQDCVRSLSCFERLAAHVVTVHHDTVHDQASLVTRLAGADALVLTRERTRITAALLDQLPRLRLIAQTGAVTGHIDLQACAQRGILVTDGSGTGAATAELTWALVLASRRHLVLEANRLKAGRWQGHLGQQLKGQRLGVWGYGRIGRQVAGYGRAFGMQVSVWGSEESMERARAEGFEPADSRASLFACSDVLSLHLRLSERTRGIVGASDLARMSPQSLLVNTSRAELVEDGALVAALQAGRPGFGALDVFENEPVLDKAHPLLNLPNALCTPHIGYVERDNYEAYFGTAFDQINAFARGEPVGTTDLRL